MGGVAWEATQDLVGSAEELPTWSLSKRHRSSSVCALVSQCYRSKTGGISAAIRRSSTSPLGGMAAPVRSCRFERGSPCVSESCFFEDRAGRGRTKPPKHRRSRSVRARSIDGRDAFSSPAPILCPFKNSFGTVVRTTGPSGSIGRNPKELSLEQGTKYGGRLYGMDAPEVHTMEIHVSEPPACSGESDCSMGSETRRLQQRATNNASN